MGNVNAGAQQAAAQATYNKNSGSDGAASPTTRVLLPTTLRGNHATPPTLTRETDDSIRLEDFDRLRLLGQVGDTRESERERQRERVIESESHRVGESRRESEREQRESESRAYNPATCGGALSRVTGSHGSPREHRGLELKCAAGAGRAGSARSSSCGARAATAASSR
jgi:hypothetical protein